MPRPKRCRRVFALPQYNTFQPTDPTPEDTEPVILTVDEYETIRLIDKEGLSQGECCEFMKISRTTVQEIYSAARKKLAEALVNGQPLKITGGNYRLCSEGEAYCGNGCHKHRHGHGMLKHHINEDSEKESLS